jgi:hypothetical protein
MQKDKYQKILGIFILFTMLFNFPFVGLFRKGGLAFGIPMLYLYLFGMWFLFIILIVWTMEKKS